MTRRDKIFCGSIGVRFGTSRAKIELSPAENYGGPAGRWWVAVVVYGGVEMHAADTLGRC